MLLTLTRWKGLVHVYFGLLAAITALFTVLYTRTSRDWVIGDWLINYTGGFVRRGLPGEIALGLQHATHGRVVWFPVLFCLGFYAVYLGCSWAIARDSRPSAWACALLLSPVTFAYQVLDMGGGGRKEVIYLAALASLLLLLRRFRLSSPAVVLALTCLTVAGTLSHELIIFYTPYLFAALVLGGRTVRRALAECAFPILLGLGVAAVCAAHPGSLAAETRVCSSIGQSVSPVKSTALICGAGGAISYLAISRQAAEAEVASTARKDRYYSLYPLLTLLALLPLVGSSLELVREGQAQRIRVLWATAACSAAGTGLLFVFALDWGRWVYIHVVSMALLLLFLRGQRETALAREAPTPRLGAVAAAGLLLYATTWTLPHANGVESSNKFGYLDVGRDLRVRLHRHL